MSIRFDTDMQSPEFKLLIREASNKVELSFLQKPIACKFGFHKSWVVGSTGLVAARAYFVCTECYHKSIFEAGGL